MTTNDRPPGRPRWTRRSTSSSATPPGEPAIASPAPREALDREEQLIRDAVLRMGALVEDAIREASRALVAHDAALALDVIKGDAIINEAQRGVSRLISVTIATQQPVARDLRYLLTLDHVTYELERMGDHAASVAKRSSSSPRNRRSRATSTCPRWPSGPPSWSTASCARWSTSTPSGPARSRSRTTRSTGSTTPPSTRSSS